MQDWYDQTQPELPVIPADPTYLPDSAAGYPSTDLTVPATDTPYSHAPNSPNWPIAAPPPPPGGSRGDNGAGRFALIAGALLVIVALIAGGVYVARHGGVGIALAGATATPAPQVAVTKAAQGYCAALQQGNATAMYSSFDSALQTLLPSAAFTASTKDIATQMGAVTTCQVGAVTMGAGNTTATVAATVTRQSNPQSLTWQMTQVNGAWLFAQAPDASLLPRATLFAYCADIQPKNYAGAYTLFTPALQQQLLSAANYKTVAGQVDAVNGAVTACATTSVTMAADGSATAQLTLKRSQTETDQTQLTAPGTGAAQISQPPDSSLLSRTTATIFCQDLVTSNFDDAFQQFTPSAQQAIGSADAFQQSVQSKEAFFGTITDCSVQGFTLNADNQSGTLSGSVTLKQLFASYSLPSTLSMVEVSTNVWKVDDATVGGQSLSG
jgi:hypothetical protein